MPALLTIDSLCLATPDGQSLVENFSMSFGRARYALVGRNGSGKTSLLNVLAGVSPPRSGTVRRHATLGYLRQDEAAQGRTAADVLGISGGLSCLARLAGGTGTPEDAANADWDLEARVAETLARAGLPAGVLDRPHDSLSGGERTRLSIARLWLEAPELLLLDEPTNNLDRQGREIVADMVRTLPGGLILASHDRALLENMDVIIELSAIGVRVFGGGWAEFAEDRIARRERAATRLSQAERNQREAERAVQRARERQARHDSMGRANRAAGGAPKSWFDAQKNRAERTAGKGSSLGHRLTGESREALQAARNDVEVVTPLRMNLPEAHVPAPRLILDFKDVVFERSARRIFGPLSFALRGGERVALNGPNGAGKSTVLRVAVGLEEPTSGTVTRGTSRIAYLDQHLGILRQDTTILDNMHRLNPRISDNAAFAELARFAFRKDAASKPVSELSGGELLRAGLACILAGPQAPELLILDEPTNHLDLESIEVLETALRSFAGTMLIVSHDREFVQATRIEREVNL